MAAWALVASLITATSAVAHGGDPRLGADTGLTMLARAGAATVTLEVQSACCGTSGSGLLLTHTGLIATSAQAEQALRTTYIFGESNRSVSAGTTSPRAGGIPADAWELRIEGGRYWYTAAGRVREGEASPGVVPREMLSALVAALPESLPPVVHVSVLDAAANRARDVTVRFGQRESRSIPVPRVGSTCGANVPTRSVAVDVVQATRQTETDMVSVVVLARRPHVILGGAGAGMTSSLKCVVIPGVVH